MILKTYRIYVNLKRFKNSDKTDSRKLYNTIPVGKLYNTIPVGAGFSLRF